MTIDEVFELAASRGLKPREWKWKPLKIYNGFTHEQRVRKWQAVDLLIRMGLKQPASALRCDICGATAKEATLSYHSEDYSSLTGDYPLCKSCHYHIHARFRAPYFWQCIIEKYGDGTRWFERLIS